MAKPEEGLAGVQEAGRRPGVSKAAGECRLAGSLPSLPVWRYRWSGRKPGGWPSAGLFSSGLRAESEVVELAEKEL